MSGKTGDKSGKRSMDKHSKSGGGQEAQKAAL